MKKLLFFLSILIFLFVSCNDDHELEKSVFVSDSELTDLPAYSEWGYNTFGSYYDRELFISNTKQVPGKILVSNDTMSFILDGQKGMTSYYSTPKTMSVTFKIAGFSPEKYSDLTALNDTTFDLKNPLFRIVINIGSIKYTPKIISGTLVFKRVQNLHVDNKQVEAIVSGTFDLNVLIDDKPFNFSDGRFDIGISTNNFYVR